MNPTIGISATLRVVDRATPAFKALRRRMFELRASKWLLDEGLGLGLPGEHSARVKSLADLLEKVADSYASDPSASVGMTNSLVGMTNEVVAK